MRIPVSNFGQRTAQYDPVRPADPSALNGGLARAAAQLGQTIFAAGQSLQEQANAQQDEDDRASAATALLNVRVDSRLLGREVANDIATGKIDPSEAEAAYTQRMDKSVAQHFESLKGNRHIQRATAHALVESREGLAVVSTAVEGARRQRAATDATATLDLAGKMALVAPIDEAVTTAAASYLPLAKRAGIPDQQAAQTLQNWTDAVRFNRAQLDLTGGRRDIESLDAFDKRLAEGGDLFARLDPGKVVALRRESESYRYQLHQQAQRDADRRETAAERWVSSTERQIEAGVPLSAQMWAAGEVVTRGTLRADRYAELVEAERETQQVLRLPLDQQQAHLDTREQKLMKEGGRLIDRANLNRLRSTVESNVKQLETAPLVAAQRLYGQAAPPLSLADLENPEGLGAMTRVFSERSLTLAAMRKQFGERVPLKPLLPDETKALVGALDKVGPSNAARLFASLRTAIGDDETYAAAMQQIAPDSPVKARAGELAAMREGVITQKNWLAADVSVSTAKVAQTMLTGEQILNRTKAQKEGDGSGRNSLFVPGRQEFDEAFSKETGNLYRGRAGAQEFDRQAAFAYLVGKSVETGRQYANPNDIDSKLVKEAIAATVGNVVDVNGNGMVKAPIGMSASEFDGKIRRSFSEAAQAHGGPSDAALQWSNFGLVNYRRDGTYALTLGGVPVVDPKTGTPVVIDVLNRSDTRYGPRGADLIPKGR